MTIPFLVALAMAGEDLVKAGGVWWRVRRAPDAIVAKIGHAAQVQARAHELRGADPVKAGEPTLADIERRMAEELELVVGGVFGYAIPIVDAGHAATEAELRVELRAKVDALDAELAQLVAAGPVPPAEHERLVAAARAARAPLDAHLEMAHAAEKVVMQERGEFTQCTFVAAAVQAVPTAFRPWVGTLDYGTRRVLAQAVSALTFDREASAARIARFLGD